MLVACAIYQAVKPMCIAKNSLPHAPSWMTESLKTSSKGVHAITTPGHTAGHMSLFIELPKGKPVILCGDAADLTENLSDEVAPGYCWQDNEALAIASICKLNALAQSENAELWPNHDFAFFNGLPGFPSWRD
jgi:N-acyl homoserine lactone hydrolase